ncbi:MAG: hypothetical protein AABY18_05640 [Candidatus Thermoplasmatota archaeon]
MHAPPPAAAAAFVVLLLLVLPTSAAPADDDLAWGREARALDVQATATGFSFTSSRNSALGSDRITGSFDADAARLAVRLDVDRPAPALVSVDLAWTHLVEYRDGNADGHLGLGDVAQQSVPVGALEHTSVLVTPRLDGGHEAAITYTLPANESKPDPLLGSGLPAAAGTLRLAFTLRPAAAAAGDLPPTRIDLAVEVTDFPFRAADSRLALVGDVGTGLGGVLGPTLNGLAATSGNHTWTLAWAAEGRADGRQAVGGGHSLSSTDRQATAVLSLPRGDNVAHEGSLAAARTSTAPVVALPDLPPGDWRFYALGLAGAVVALGVPSLRRLRGA